MARLAIVTGTDAPDLTEDGGRLRASLADRGVDARGAVWHDGSVDWDAFDAVLLRSCWGYYREYEAFEAWLDAREAAGQGVLNPPDVVRWNARKSYLTDLAGRGVPVVPTEYVEPEADRSLAAILAERGWDEAVVKPAVGTSAAGVWRTSTETAAADQERFEEPFDAARKVGDTADPADGGTLSDRGALVQQFYPEVRDSERSMLYFRGRFSHAWESLRAPDAVGVEPRTGAAGAFEPALETRETASEVLAAAADNLGYTPADFTHARVDGVCRDGEFHLLELELIEPYLNLGAREGAVDAYADAIVRRLAEAPSAEQA